MSFKYISLFSGIEAASAAWEPLGWEPMAFSEIDLFPSAVLAARYPDVPNLGDITKVDWKEFVHEHGRPDVLVGGSPCQSFSVAAAAKRTSLGGESRLMFEYIRACEEVHSTWIVWENVPGVFSVKDRAFEQLITSLQDIGYVSLAWRVLDAQFVRMADRDGDGRIVGWHGPVAQRRRRVFLVGHLGDGGGAAAVLFESESVRGNTQASREKRQELTEAARGRSRGSDKDRLNADEGAFGLNRQIVSEGGTAQGPVETYELCPTLDTHSKPHGTAYAVRTANSGANGHGIAENVAHTVATSHPEAVAFAQNSRDEVEVKPDDDADESDAQYVQESDWGGRLIALTRGTHKAGAYT